MAERRKQKCKAKSSRTGLPCNKWAMDGKNVCSIHGGKGGAPKGNKNGLKTGQYEHIFADCLTEEENEIFTSMDTETLARAYEELRILTIRERRMLKRIEHAQLKGSSEEISTKYETRIKSETRIPVHNESGQFTGYMIQRETEPVEMEKTIKRKSTEDLILAIEAALTQVQKQKSTVLALIHQIESGGDPEEDDDIEGFINALNGSADKVWSDYGKE